MLYFVRILYFSISMEINYYYTIIGNYLSMFKHEKVSTHCDKILEMFN